MISCRNSASDALGCSHREVLRESRRALDGGRVDALCGVDVVRAAIGGHAAFVGCAGGGVAVEVLEGGER